MLAWPLPHVRRFGFPNGLAREVVCQGQVNRGGGTPHEAVEHDFFAWQPSYPQDLGVNTLPLGDNMANNYENLKAEVQRMRAEGTLELWPSREQRIDWAYGTTKIENSAVTRQMAEMAVDLKSSAR